ncbi:hypothetical protein SGPA1_11892 [Streptomyces misionensis JCM 4497]
MGPGAVLGQDPRGRRPDDQRPRGDRAREARLPPCLRRPPVHPARRRLLRMGDRAAGAGPGGRGEEEAAPQAAVLRAARRRLGVRDGRPLRVLARPDAARRPPPGLAGHLLGDHHGGRADPAGRLPGRGPPLARGHPPPDAADAHPGPLGRLAGPLPHRPGGAARPARPAPAGADARLPGRHRRQQRPQQRTGAAEGAGGPGRGHTLLA